MDKPKNITYLPIPIVNKLSSTPDSKSSLEEIKYKNRDLKKANNKRTDVFNPIVSLKISITKPIKKA